MGFASGAAPSDPEALALAKLPDPPADHIFDAGGIFTRHPDRRAVISERLRALKAEHDLTVYVAVYAGIFDSSLQERSRLLYKKWIGPEREGVVVVYDADMREREIVTPGTLYAKLEGGDMVSRLPDYQIVPILAELRVTLEGVEDRIDYLDRTIEILAARLAGLLRERPTGIADRSTLGLVVVTLALGVALTLLGIYGNRRLHLAERRAREQFFFPEVTMVSRLGAPFSGGRQSVVRFKGVGEPEGEDSTS